MQTFYEKFCYDIFTIIMTIIIIISAAVVASADLGSSLVKQARSVWQQGVSTHSYRISKVGQTHAIPILYVTHTNADGHGDNTN